MKNYSIGLDIGTTSVGWACVNLENYKVLKRGSKSLWGVRLFEEATPALDRRLKRSTRRRYDRRRDRIRLLQEEFEEEMNKVDSNFFKKLKDSFYSEKDKENSFIKFNLEDKEIYNKYKTIYHLRNELMETNEKKDIRHIYLAIHHILKYRGNFNYEGKFNIDKIDILEGIKNLFDIIYNLTDKVNIEDVCDDDYKKIEKILLIENKKDCEKLLKEELKKYIEKDYNEIGNMILGNKFSIIKLFEIEDNEIDKISFKDSNLEENFEKLANILNEKIEILGNALELYNMLFLKHLFKGDNKTLSSLMIDKYNNHHKDLSLLKNLIRNDKQEYKKIFKSSKDKKIICYYDKYISNNISYEDFVKELNKVLDKVKDNDIEKYNIIKEKIENKTLLTKITNVDNGKFPVQLNEMELIKIIENQGKYYPFLKNKINDEYKLLKLLKFKIPYYVGPLNSKNSLNAWIERDYNIKITPYNFDEVVDKEKTAEKFIKRMLGHCTYLKDEIAMPLNSILYSKFKVLQELKQIKINDIKLTNEQINDIYNNLFLKVSRITEKKFIDYIKTSKEFDIYNNIEVKGYSSDKKFASDMQSYIDLKELIDIYSIDKIERIIELITIFEDKDILRSKLIKEYNKLTDEQINKIVKLKYKGWSNLSKKLLTDVKYYDKEKMEYKSIMDLLEETTLNFMQIINDKKYDFQNLIDKLNKVDITKKINYDLVCDLKTSPAIKRGIYQALKIVEEIIDYVGYEPSYISIEMARGEEKKERKDTRLDYIKKIYDEFKNDIDDYKKLNNQLKNIDKIEDEKQFLYFIQQGKCLYTGTELDFNDLSLCEVDHIIPRCIIKDDSIENKALVLMEANQLKKDRLVLPDIYRKNMSSFWKRLHECKLITSKKIYNLTRSEYKKEDIEGFINRQLVETRQITKHVANILKNYYKDTEIIYLHANLSSSYRNKFNLYKFRDINDYHHAHDAYLASVLGYYQDKYINKDINFEGLKELNKYLIDNKKYRELHYGYIINSLDNDITLENIKTGEVFDNRYFNDIVEKTLYRNDILISKKTEIRTGKFYEETKNSKCKSGVPLKHNLNTNLYGSYTGLIPSYAVVVKYTKKGENFQKLIGIPIYYTVNKGLDDYIKGILNLKDSDRYELVYRNNRLLKIPFNTLIDWEGSICSLVGATSNYVEVCNAKEFNIEKNNMIVWKDTLNHLLNKSKKDINMIVYENQLGDIIKYIINKVVKEYKLYLNLKDDMIKMFKIDELDSLSLEQKENIIIQMFNLLKYNSTNANLKFLSEKYSMAFGKKHNKTIPHGKLIYKSYTGLKEKYYEF